MRRPSLSRLSIAALLGAIAGCNALLVQFDDGYSDKSTSSATGGTAGTGGTHSASSSSSSGNTTGGGGTGGDGGPDADADVEIEAGPPPGDTVWARSFGDSQMIDEVVNGVAVGGPQDHIFITGRADDPSVFKCPSTDGGTDAEAGASGTAFLVELNPNNGACLWGYFFGADAEGTAVAADSLGNVVVAGTYRGEFPIDSPFGPAAMATDSFIAYFDVTHSLQWVRRVTENSASGDQRITSIAMAANKVAAGGTYDLKPLRILGPTGFTTVDVTGTPEGIDTFVVLFNTDGSYVNTLVVSSPAGLQPQSATGVAVRAPDGAFAVTGTTKGPTKFNGAQVDTGFDESIFLGIYDSSKTELGKLIIGDGSPQYGKRVAFDGSGAVVLTGDFLGTVLAAGQGADAGASVVNQGGTDIFIARYTETGAPAAILPLGLDPLGTNNATVGGLAVYENLSDKTQKNILLAGAFSGSFGVNGVPTVSATGANNDVFVAKLAFALDEGVWIKRFGDSAEQVATGVAADTKGNVIVVGNYQGVLDFGKAGSKLNNTGVGSTDIFVAKLFP